MIDDIINTVEQLQEKLHILENEIYNYQQISKIIIAYQENKGLDSMSDIAFKCNTDTATVFSILTKHKLI